MRLLTAEVGRTGVAGRSSRNLDHRGNGQTQRIERQNSAAARVTQAELIGRRIQQLNRRAADLASNLAVMDDKRARTANNPEEVAELRASAAILRGFARRLRQEEVAR